jgi:hypothetical protein
MAMMLKVRSVTDGDGQSGMMGLWGEMLPTV